MSSMFKLGIIQMCSGPSVRNNLEKASAFIQKAANGNARLAILPENVLCQAEPDIVKHNALSLKSWMEMLKDIAVESGIYILWGGIPVLAGNKHLY